MSNKKIIMNLDNWDPENKEFWNNYGKSIARRNLFFSIPCLLLSFSVWFIWSAVVVKLNSIGFNFTNAELFMLAAVPGLSGATLRIFYSFVVPIFGGRNWTVFSNITLLIPCIGIGYAVQNTNTSYETMLILALFCGFGGGNFSSSMSNISFFFPIKEKGTALGLNAGLGNLGVSLLQFIVPIVISVNLFSFFGLGKPQMFVGPTGKMIPMWIHNAALIWIVPIILSTVCAFFFMNNLPNTKSSLISQLVIFKRKHMYITTLLYIMSFGSFIGYSAAFPLLIKIQFPEVNALKYAFIGPMMGAIIRPLGGWVSDKIGGGMVTIIDLFVMIFAVLGVLYFLNVHVSFVGFLIMFVILFITTGIANGSVFQMIPVIFKNLKESAAVLGFSAAIAAYGAFFIPKTFGYSIQKTGDTNAAFYFFIIYYILCIIITWWYYLRKNAEVKC